MNVLDFSTSNAQVIDEIINVSDANPVALKHNTFYNKAGKAIVIATGPGGTGTILTNPLDGASDYTPGDAYTFPEPYNTTLAGDIGYQTIAITNAGYHSTDLYVSYYPIWDLVTAERWNNNNIIPNYLSSPYDISATTVEIDLTTLNSYPDGTTLRISAYDGDGSDYLWFTDNGETINGIPIADFKIEGTGGFIITKISDGVFKAVGELGGEIWDSDGGNFGKATWEKRLNGSIVYDEWEAPAGDNTTELNPTPSFQIIPETYLQLILSWIGVKSSAPAPTTITDFNAYNGSLLSLDGYISNPATGALALAMSKTSAFSVSNYFGYRFGYKGLWATSYPRIT